LKAIRGSPGGAWILAVATYSSNARFVDGLCRSTVMTPKLPRNTNFGRNVQATPNRGWKLFRSRLASNPFGCVIAPSLPVMGSTTVGSNCDCCPYLVVKGLS
jgi:hypothetical protein